jgi:hypothetical protein
MSAKAIERLAETGAFEPSEGFTELSERHVDFDQLVGGKKREAALGKLLQRAEPVKVAVRGPSGSGKSSMIAATLADLPGHLPLPIAIASADIGILQSQTFSASSSSARSTGRRRPSSPRGQSPDGARSERWRGSPRRPPRTRRPANVAARRRVGRSASRTTRASRSRSPPRSPRQRR